MLVPPSPKFQLHDVGDPVELSVNCTVRGAVPDVGVPENAATGIVAAFTVIRLVCVQVLLPAAFTAVRVTEYVPVVW